MIPRFRDHAANERTYLAWVRTAVAIMAFGFLVERFDLFLAYLGRSGSANTGPEKVNAKAAADVASRNLRMKMDSRLPNSTQLPAEMFLAAPWTEP